MAQAEPIIEIQGGLVRHINRQVMSEIALSEYLPRIALRTPVTMPVFPRSGVASHYDDSNPQVTKLKVALEIGPGIRGIKMGYGDDYDTTRLSMPWTYFYFDVSSSNPRDNLAWSINDYRIFFARRRYQGLDDRMIAALLPNVYDDGRICFGDTAPDADQNIADRLDTIVNEWYESNFNRDLTIRYPNNQRNWRQWQRMTETTPLGWQDWSDWHDRESFTMRGMFEANLQRTDPIIIEGRIADIPLGMTFGRADQWVSEILNNNDRIRLEEALVVRREEHPEEFIPVATTFDPEDDDENFDDDEEDLG